MTERTCYKKWVDPTEKPSGRSTTLYALRSIETSELNRLTPALPEFRYLRPSTYATTCGARATQTKPTIIGLVTLQYREELGAGQPV